MINLNNSGRDIDALAEAFYKQIKIQIEAKIINKKTFLNGYKTDFSNTPFGDYLENKIKDIITLPLNELITKVDVELNQLFSKNYITVKKTKNSPKKKDPFKLAIDEIFFYENHDEWKAYRTAKNIGNNTCPYCNRNYITVLGTDDKKFVRGDFDHFLAKSIYPYFRFSFYNLIPCCVICNRNAKGKGYTSIENNCYPYSEGFENDIMFTYLPKNYNEVIGRGNPEIDFLFLGDIIKTKKAEGNIKLFKLKQQYSIHTQELNDIINKRRIFSSSYLKELQIKYPSLLRNNDEAYYLAFGKELDLATDENRPLSKFTRDIAKDIGLL